jgi:type I restriction enzyme, S subunit
LVGFKKVEAGQVVMNRMRAAIGMFGLADQPGLVSPDYAVLQPIEGILPMYYLRLFKTQAARTAFRVESKGLGTGSSGFMRLYWDRFGAIKLPVPPREEQKQVVEWILDRTKKLEEAQDRVRRELGLFKDLRQRLIVDAVTGKLDVREAAARLPVAGEEPISTEVDTLVDGVEGDLDDSTPVGEEAES